ncbi:MAG TPA: alpha/beta hydrolase-fold protein [Polyangia bacterium]|nr:alpha/beta hydrolase-fold protein [Polyangia bacterium]
MADTPFATVELSDPRFERDGLRLVTVKSPALGRRADLTVFVPPGGAEPLPLVVLLHGVNGSHWSWSMRGGAHLTAARLIETGELPPVAIAMPSDGLWGDGTGYVPHPDADYERWIVDEVPQAAALADERVGERSSIFVAGMSMGGFGALRLGAKYPARFAGISAHSAVTTLARLREVIGEPLADLDAFGTPDGTALHWLEAHRARLPPLRFDCGTGDGLLAGNRALHAALEARGVEHVYEEFPGGHDWPYWKLHVADTLRFFGALAADDGVTPPH